MKKKTIDLAAAQNSYQFPYIAVMTILCIFFLMLYAYYYKIFEETNSARNEEIASEMKKDLRSVKGTSVEVMEDGIKVTLPTSIIFTLGSDGIQDWVVPVLNKLSESVKTLPDDYRVSVEGHTDNAPVWYGGDFSSNWELSLYRAMSIIDMFIRNGDTPDRFIATGYGQYRPLVPNDTPEHRAANRRVEIIIRKKVVEDTRLEKLRNAQPR